MPGGEVPKGWWAQGQSDGRGCGTAGRRAGKHAKEALSLAQTGGNHEHAVCSESGEFLQSATTVSLGSESMLDACSNENEEGASCLRRPSGTGPVQCDSPEIKSHYDALTVRLIMLLKNDCRLLIKGGSG